MTNFLKNIFLVFFYFIIIFNCIFVSSLKADPTYLAVEQNEDEFDLTTGITFNNDGSKMYVVGSLDSKDRIVEYNLTTNYDVSTKSVSHRLLKEGSNTGTNTVLADITFRPHDIRFNNDGTRMYLPMFLGHVETYSLSTAFAISSASLVDDTFNPSENTAGSLAMEFNSTGTKVFIGDGTHIDEYDVATAFDLTSTVTFVDKLSVDFAPQSMAFSDDGTVLFVLTQASNNKYIYEYNLTTGFDLSTATYVDKFDVENREVRPHGIAFNSDGDKVFITGTDGDPGSGNDDEINTFSLSPKYNLGNPTLTSSSPADNATGVAVDANIVLNFSESVNVNSGEITIHKSSDDVKVATIDVTSSNVTGAGTSQITINPTDHLEYGIEYYVLIPARAFVDSNSNPGYSSAISAGALSFTVNSDRTDPTTIKDVIGLIDAQNELAKNYITQSIDTVSYRMRYLRQNKSSDALSYHDLPIHIDVGDTTLTSLVNDKLSVNENLSKNTDAIMPDSWSAWSTASIYASKIGDSLNSSSQKTKGQTLALGFDKKLNDSDFLGFAIQTGQSDTDIGTNGTRIDSEKLNFSIYRTKILDDNNFIETFLGIGSIKNDLKRVHIDTNILTGLRDGTQIFGSINYGKTSNYGDFNITPVGRLDLGYTKLDGYTETGVNALNYSSQRIESGLASFGFEFSDNIQINKNKLQPFGSLTYTRDFSNYSDAKINYVADTSTIYTYTQQANSTDLISSLIGFKYTARDYLNINSSYKRTQGNNEYRDAINFAFNFKSNRETQYMLSLAGDENIDAKLGISKNIHGFDLGFNANQSLSDTSIQNAEVKLSYSF